MIGTDCKIEKSVKSVKSVESRNTLVRIRITLFTQWTFRAILWCKESFLYSFRVLPTLYVYIKPQSGWNWLDMSAKGVCMRGTCFVSHSIPIWLSHTWHRWFLFLSSRHDFSLCCSWMKNGRQIYENVKKAKCKPTH